MLRRDSLQISTRPGFATGVVLTVPTFPYQQGYEALGKGTPSFFRDSMTAVEREQLHFAEVALQQGKLVASGTTGYVGVATGMDQTVEQACSKAYDLAHKVVAPNLRYRNDIGQRIINGEWSQLQALGYLGKDSV